MKLTFKRDFHLSPDELSVFKQRWIEKRIEASKSIKEKQNKTFYISASVTVRDVVHEFLYPSAVFGECMRSALSHRKGEMKVK